VNLDSKTAGRRAVWAIVIVGVVSVLVDFTYTKHGHLPVENWIGFHAGYGFVSCVALVFAARGLRRILMRDENYYD
jgi:hypothetical protein